MNTPIKISVIMPVYNTNPAWLKEAIDSILNQTYPNFEFIIINDGSTDATIDSLILSYTDPRIRYYTQINQGIAATLNRGISLSTGPFIARMDADDISFPERFAKQVAFLESHPEISVLGSYFEIFPDKQLVQHPLRPTYMNFLKNCCIGHPTIMLRKADLDRHNLRYNPAYKCEDYELWSRAIRVLKFANLPEVLLKYRWHGKNLSQSTATFDASVKQVQQNMLNFLTSDAILQQQLLLMLYPRPIEKNSFIENIFSIKNSSDRHNKIFTILGIKIKIKRNKQP